MITLQYIIIALIFVAAIIYMVRKFMPSKNKSGCNKGCGSCSDIQNKVN